MSSQLVSHVQKLHLKCPVTVPFEATIKLTKDTLDEQTSELPVVEEASYYTELHRPLKQMIQYLSKLARNDSEGNPDWNQFKPISWENQECMGYAMLKDFGRSARQHANGQLKVQLEDGTVRNDQGTLQYQTRAQVNGKSEVSRWYDGQKTDQTLQTDAAKPWTLTKTYQQLKCAPYKESGMPARDGRRGVHKRPTGSSAGASDGGAGTFDGAGLYGSNSQVVGSTSSVSGFMGPPLKRRALTSNASENWPPSASQVEQAVFDLEPLDTIMGPLDVMRLYAREDDRPGVDIVRNHLTKFRQQFEGGGATSASVSSGVDFRYFDVATGALRSLGIHAAELLRPEIAKISDALAEIKKPFRARSSLSVFSGHEQESAPLHDLGDQTRISPLASHEQQPGIGSAMGSAIGDLPEGSSRRGDGGQKPARDPFLSNLLN